MIITFVEAFWRGELESDYHQIYSYTNDVISIMTLLASALRFPVYFSISQPIRRASMMTLRKFSPVKKVLIRRQMSRQQTTIVTTLDSSTAADNHHHRPGTAKRTDLQGGLVSSEPYEFRVKLALPEEDSLLGDGAGDKNI